MEQQGISQKTSSISVAMATYNGAQFLRQQLESIAKQSLLPSEVVITDDQSSDSTMAIIEEFSRNAPFVIRAFRNENRLRYADNFLRAASLCTGDLVAFCDQDDIWLEDKLSRCAAYFQDQSVQLICHTAQTLFTDGTLGYKFPKLSRTEVLRPGASDPLENLPGFAMVVRRELLHRFPSIGRPERLYSHDHWVFFLASVVGTVVKLNDVLVHYRQHGSNVFGAHNKTMGFKLKAAVSRPRYLDVAKAESECSRYLIECTSSIDTDAQRSATVWAKKLAFRSSLHTARYQIHDSSTSFLNRFLAYTKIFLKGGYLPDSSRTRLGPKAGLKDLVMGVGNPRRTAG